MTLTVSEVTKFITSDGKEHTTFQMAKQHVLFEQLCEQLNRSVYLRADVDSADIINFIGSNANAIREFLDANDALTAS